MVTYQAFLDRVIAEGMDAARADYERRTSANAPDMLAGSLAGFRECKDLLPTQLQALLARANADAHEKLFFRKKDYWYYRCRAAEVEWVCNVVSAALVNEGSMPLAGNLPTVRGYLKAATILGVADASWSPGD